MRENNLRRRISAVLTRTVAGMLAVVMCLSVTPIEKAEASGSASVVLGAPACVHGLICFPEATVTLGGKAKSMTVTVDKGWIASTDFTSADVLTKHQTATWKFSSELTPEEAAQKLRTVEFGFETGMKVTVTVDSNVSSTLPAGATITSFDGHADGKMHYYMFVPGYPINWKVAYNNAKSFSYMGLKGYLATMTQIEEDKIIDKLTPDGAWAGGARLANSVIAGGLDKDSASGYVTAGTSSSTWVWTCGPEAGTLIKSRTLAPASPAASAGVIFGNSGYSNWSESQPDGSASSGEWNMQVHFGANTSEHIADGAPMGWNDLPEAHNLAKGYIVEFSEYDGGTVDGYSAAGTATVSEIIEHEHQWKYSVEDGEIVAHCISTTDFRCEYYEEEAVTTTVNISDGAPTSDYVEQDNEDEWEEYELPEVTYTYKKIPDDGTVLTKKPTTPGEYVVQMTITDDEGEEFTVSRPYVIDAEDGVTASEATEDANSGEPSYINRAYGYILYESDKHRDDAIRRATDDNGAEVAGTYLNMTTEKVVTDMEVACYTFNGTTWKAGNLDAVNAQFDKAANSQIKLKIASAYDDKKKKPADGAVVYSFGTIKRRDNTNSFTVNYYLCRDDYGLSNGQWCLVNAQKQDRGVNFDTYEIGICDNGKTIGSKGYGVWPADGIFPTCGGVWVSDLPQNGKTAKEVYLYRKAATEDMVASKPKKLTVSTVLTAPKIKVDYKKETIKIKEGMSIYFGDQMPVYVSGSAISMYALPSSPAKYSDYYGHAVLKITKNAARNAINISSYIQEVRNTIKIWQGATSKKPMTATQVIRLAARASAPTAEQCVTIKDGVAKLNKGYEIKTGSGKNAKWTTSIPKVTKDVEYQVRRKLDAKGGAENDTTFASGIEGTLKLTYGTYDEAKKKKGFISAVVE